MVPKMFPIVVKTQRQRPAIVPFLLYIFISINIITADEQSLQRQLGCVWRSKNASLFCLVFENNNNNNKSQYQTGDVIRQQRGATKFIDLECVQNEQDLKKISAKSDNKNSFVDDYLDDDDDGRSSLSRELWTQLQFVRVKGCPLHQVDKEAVSNNNNNNNNNNSVRQFSRPLLRGADLKSDDFFSDFLQPTIGGRIDLAKVRGLDMASSGLNRPLSSRTRTFCELSETLTSLDLSENFFTTLYDIFGAASKAADKCPFAKLSSIKISDNQVSYHSKHYYA